MRGAFRPVAVIAAAATLCALLASCAAPQRRLPPAEQAAIEQERLLQQELAVRIGFEREQRLAELSWPLRRDGAELCGDKAAPEFGFRFESSLQYDRDERRAAVSALGLRSAPTVTMVIPDGPADLAGIQPGDVLTHVGRFRLRDGERGVEDGMKRLREFTSDRERLPAVPLRFERDGVATIQEVIPELLCDFPVVLWPDDAINAFADGSKAYITTGMMRFAETDEELQVVIAHELAHNIEGHVSATRKNAIFGALIGLAAEAILASATGVDLGGGLTLAGMAAGQKAHSQDFEREADYVGMYLLARAGVDTGDVSMFWRRMAVENTGSIENNHRSTHPSTPERYIRLDAAHGEIVRKRMNDLPLIPNAKDDRGTQ